MNTTSMLRTSSTANRRCRKEESDGEESRGEVMGMRRATVLVMGLLRPGKRIRPGGCIQVDHGETVNTTRHRVCVLALVLLFLALEAGSMPSRDASTAEVRVASTGTIAPTTTLSPKPSAEGWAKDKATGTLAARFKTHSVTVQDIGSG